MMKEAAMTDLSDRIGFRRERAHCGASSVRERIRQVLANGTHSQSKTFYEIEYELAHRPDYALRGRHSCIM
jgi:hypothetical protein